MKSLSTPGALDGVAPKNERHPTFHEAFLFWLKLGFISFGGPAGQIAVMHAELVDLFAILVGAVAFIGMVRWKWDIVPVVLTAGFAGLIFKMILKGILNLRQ